MCQLRHFPSHYCFLLTSFFLLDLTGKQFIPHSRAIQKINTEKTNGYMANLVNLRSVTCYTDQNFKSKCSFRSSKYLHLEKRFKESYRTSISLEDLDVDFVLQHFNQCLFVNEADDQTES